MIPELILSGGLAATGGVAGYLYYEHFRSKATQAEEAKVRLVSFRDALLRELKATRRGEFHFEEFAASCEIPLDDARRIGDEIYSRMSRKVFADGITTGEERASLDGLATALAINADRARSIEKNAKEAVYHTRGFRRR